MINSLSYKSANTIPLYSLVSSFIVETGVIQCYYINPVFARTATNNIMIFHRYSRKKSIIQLRMSTTVVFQDETMSIKKWCNFPLTYDNLAHFLFIDDCEDKELAIEYLQKQLFVKKVDDNHLKLILIPDKGQDRKIQFELEADQYLLLQQQIKESLHKICGWSLGDDMLTEKDAQIQ